MLKRTIREAKLKHYGNLFNQFRGDMTMTWKTISEIMCKSNNKRKELEKNSFDSNIITDKGDTWMNSSRILDQMWLKK